MGISWPGATLAEPFVPTNDEQVLERLPFRATNPAVQELNTLRAQRGREPDNMKLAVILAKRYIEQGRAESDPRYYGYAQAALSPWWGIPKPPSEILVLRATIRQNQHDFEGALADLSQVLSADPANPQAWVTRALILQVQGHFEEAKRNCLPLLRLSTPLVATTCLSGVASLNGQAEKSYHLLHRSLDNAPEASPDERLWALTVLAEIATRLGNSETAEQHFKQALGLGFRDSYLFGAYADFLLDEGRPAEVIRLLQDETRVDGLLLRLALAEQAIRALNLSDRIGVLRARFEASRQRQDVRHRREEARFTLLLLKEPVQALQLAKANWAVQREPWDARVLLEAALAAHDPSTAQPVLDWLKKTRLEDPPLERLNRQLKAVQP